MEVAAGPEVRSPPGCRDHEGGRSAWQTVPKTQILFFPGKNNTELTLDDLVARVNGAYTAIQEIEAKQGKLRGLTLDHAFVAGEALIAIQERGVDPRPWDCAKVNWSSHGLDRDWPRDLFIFLNPPFHRYQVAEWVERLAKHGNGIALLHGRTETEWFEPIWQHASGILFLADRIKFCRPDGSTLPYNSGAPAILVAFGDDALQRLQRCGIAGVLVTGWQMVPAHMEVAA